MKDVKAYILEFKQVRNFQAANTDLLADKILRDAVFSLIKEEEYPFPEYSSWIAVHFFSKNGMKESEYELLWKTFVNTENHTVQRNTLNALLSTQFPLSENGEVLDRIFQLISKPQTLPANLFAGFNVLEKHYLKKYPELLPELKAICLHLTQSEKASVKAMLRSFDKKHQLFSGK
ncbi:MAG: hypothetical protein ACK479_13865 [Fluviicola sp.]